MVPGEDATRGEPVGPNLPLSADDVELTLLPLERATQLPPRAFTDPDVLAWELEHVFRRGWIGACHIDQLAGRGRFVMVELGAESVLIVADEDGLPRAFVELLPAPRLAHRRQPRGHGAAADLPLPRVELRLRRLAAQRAVHGRSWWTSTPPATGCSRSRSPSSRGSCCSTCPARRPPRRARRRPARAPRPLPARRAAARRADHLRRRGELEGDRRELQRVPALPGRAPGAQPALALPERRVGERRRRLVRRLDDALRARRDDGPGGRHQPPAARSRA